MIFRVMITVYAFVTYYFATEQGIIKPITVWDYLGKLYFGSMIIEIIIWLWKIIRDKNRETP